MTEWTVEFLDDDVEQEFLSLPADIRARLIRISSLIEEHGLSNVGMPYVRHLEGKLWEMRAKGKDGIGRSLYVTASGKRVVVLRAFQKKTQKTPRREIQLALKRAKEI